jgi:preprotein translocase subunit SecA
MFYDVAEEIVNVHNRTKDFDSFELDLVKYLKIQSPIAKEEYQNANPGQLIDTIYDFAMTRYEEKSDKLCQTASPVISQVLQNEGERYKNMMLPITDGVKSMNVVVNLEEGHKSEGKILKKQIEKMITLGYIDNEWKEHLRQMDDLRTAVQHAQIEQKDPLVIYKKESFELFRIMMGKMSKEVVSFLAKADLPRQTEQSQVSTTNEVKTEGAFENAQEQSRVEEFSGSEGYDKAIENSGQQQKPKRKPVVVEPKIGRNDKVEIRNLQNGELKTLKFKQAEALLKTRQWVLVRVIEE